MRLDVENPAPDQKIRYIPFVGDVAAGTGVLAQEIAHELMSIPEQFAGRGDSFVLEVRGESMIEAGILSGDYVVVQRQTTANKGEIVVAEIPGRRGDGQALLPARHSCGPEAGELHDGADGVRRPRRVPLRQGHLGLAELLDRATLSEASGRRRRLLQPGGQYRGELIQLRERHELIAAVRE